LFEIIHGNGFGWFSTLIYGCSDKAIVSSIPWQFKFFNAQPYRSFVGRFDHKGARRFFLWLV